MCTRATEASGAYEDAFAAAPHLQVTTRACPRFVEFVEAGVTAGPELLAAAHDYLDPVAAAEDVYRQLVENDLVRDPGLSAPHHRFVTTGDPQAFAAFGRRFLGPELGAAEVAAAGAFAAAATAPA